MEPRRRDLRRAAVGTEFLSPYPSHTHTNGDPHGDPHTYGRPGLSPRRGDGVAVEPKFGNLTPTDLARKCRIRLVSFY